MGKLRYGQTKYDIRMYTNETEALIKTLKEHGPFHKALEIGIAGGWTTKYIREHVDIIDTVTVDNGGRSNYFEAFDRKSNNFTEILGDSKDPEIIKQITSNGPYDLIGIDGEHTEEAATLDLSHATAGTLVWMHDLRACEGVRRVWEKATKGKEIVLKPIGTLGIGAFIF